MPRPQAFQAAALAPAIGRNRWGAAASVLDTFLTDLNIIRGLMLRNLRIKHKNNPLGIAVELMRPVAICLAHYFYFSLQQRPVPGHQYIVFTVGGFTIWFTYAAAYGGTLDGAKWPAGINALSGISIMHLRIARVAWAYVLHVFFAFAIVPVLELFGLNITMPMVMLTLVTYGMAVGLGFGWGMICDSIGHVLPAIMPFIKILEWIVFITSGVYDSLVTMPYLMAQIVQYNPIIDLAEYQRHAYFQGYPIYLVSLTYPLIWMVGLIFFGLLTNRALSSRR